MCIYITGVVAKTILQTVLHSTGGYPDFVLCMGDDVSDEHMYTRCVRVLSCIRMYTYVYLYVHDHDHYVYIAISCW